MVSAEQSSLRPPPRKKVTIAVLDESTASQLGASLASDSDLELRWTGTSVDKLRRERPKVQVLLADIAHLGDEPSRAMDELIELTGAELGIALYAFAKRSLLDSLSSSRRVRTMRGPLNLPMLRCQMMGLIARNVLSGSSVRAPEIRPPRYSLGQLGKLQQISTAIDCECPTQLAVVLQNLTNFEAYSKDCESRNEEDARVHRMLYEATARARLLMEDALEQLIAHENLEI